MKPDCTFRILNGMPSLTDALAEHPLAISIADSYLLTCLALSHEYETHAQLQGYNLNQTKKSSNDLRIYKHTRTKPDSIL